MDLSKDAVLHVAKLAKLTLADDEVEAFRVPLSEILSFAEKIERIGAQDVPPTTHPLPLGNVFREDSPHQSLPVEVAVTPAPCVEGNRIRVPRIVGGGTE